ncbi:MAG TPA: enhanced serine sensitivity protein SseB C-terminal domain-containing protein [Verrucomicrobiae bacterium]|nr:enhanced serine sensitivity protein SseB C-terminal domain-containing protein [Verrucomicrobiae bacterium]
MSRNLPAPNTIRVAVANSKFTPQVECVACWFVQRNERGVWIASPDIDTDRKRGAQYFRWARRTMSWFRSKIKPSRPAETIRPPQIEFVGEQAGPVEGNLKARFCPLFASTHTVESAYLARVSYGDNSHYSVALCIRSSIGVDPKLRERLAQIFAEVFRADQHLDILFMREDQEMQLQKVCKPFYQRERLTIPPK